MILFATALLPVFLLILLGYLLNRFAFPSELFWPLAARITYFVLLPALLIKTMATADFAGVPIVGIALVFTLAISLVSLLLLLLRSRLPIDGPAFTSVFQGGIRQNSYVGLAAAAGLLGESQLVFAAIALAVQIPVVNLWSVAVLARFGRSGHDGAGNLLNDSNRIVHTLISIVRNPLIIACALGIAFNPLLSWLTAAKSPVVVTLLTTALLDVLTILGRAALPIGLLTVGAGLRLAIERATLPSISVSIGTKLVLYPAFAAALCWLFGVRDSAYLSVLIFATLPTSTSSYILSREMGGDHELMAAILTVETLLALLSMPFVLMLLR